MESSRAAPPEGFVGGILVEAIGARVAEVYLQGLGGFPEGMQRAEECARRRAELHGQIHELREMLREVAALAKADRGEVSRCRQQLTSQLDKAQGCCLGLRSVAASLEASELAQRPATEAEQVAAVYASLMSKITDCQNQIKWLEGTATAAAVGGPAARREPCGCLAGLAGLWARRARRAEPASWRAQQGSDESKAAPKDTRQPGSLRELLLRECGPSPRILCADTGLAEALLADVVPGRGFVPAVTCVAEDPMQAMRLSRALGKAAAVGSVVPGSPRATARSLALRGHAFDAVILEERQLLDLPEALLAPGGRKLALSSLPVAEGATPKGCTE